MHYIRFSGSRQCQLATNPPRATGRAGAHEYARANWRINAIVDLRGAGVLPDCDCRRGLDDVFNGVESLFIGNAE